mgnify:CR=1 FL=1
MQQSVRRPGLLPPNCIRRIDRPGHREPHYIYGPNCLNSEGWRDARR